MNVIQSIHSAFGKSPEHVARAIQYAVENPEAKPEEIVGKVKEELAVEDQAAIAAERDALKMQVAELEAKIAELTGEKDEMSKTGETQKAELSALKTQVEEFSKKRSFGIRPLSTEAKAEDKQELKGIARTSAAFAKKAK